MPPRPLLVACLLAGLLTPACMLVTGHSGRPLPSASAVAPLLAARATRPQVLAALGPSDEYRSPRPLQARELEPHAVRVAEDGRLLLPERTLSWTRERRDNRRLTLIPVLNLFSWRHDRRELERLLLRFDADGRLASATRLEGGGA